MSNLVLKENQDFMGIQIPVIEGGFGEGQKVMLVKTISEIHQMELRDVNKLINNNLEEFETGIDILDLKGNKDFAVIAKNSGIYTQNSINASSNIYLLSEQGYMALVGLMRTDKAKEIRRKLRREYFSMRSELKIGQTKTLNPDLKQKEIETKNNNSFARVVNSIEKALRNPNVTKKTKDNLNNKLNQFLGEEPKDVKHLGKKTYSATEIGKKLGVSSQKIGRLTEKHKLKTEEFGEWFKDKSKYSSKEVPSFRYYENVIPVLKGLLDGKQEKLEV